MVQQNAQCFETNEIINFMIYWIYILWDMVAPVLKTVRFNELEVCHPNLINRWPVEPYILYRLITYINVIKINYLHSFIELYYIIWLGLFLVRVIPRHPHPHPLKCGQIENMIQKDAQCFILETIEHFMLKNLGKYYW